MMIRFNDTDIGCLHGPANVQQTSSKCIQIHVLIAGNLLQVCWTFAGSLRLHDPAFIQLAGTFMVIRRAGGL